MHDELRVCSPSRVDGSQVTEQSSKRHRRHQFPPRQGIVPVALATRRLQIQHRQGEYLQNVQRSCPVLGQSPSEYRKC